MEFLEVLYPSRKAVTGEGLFGEVFLEANVASLLRIADRYDVTSIMDDCERFLCESTAFTMLQKLQFAEDYRLVMLQVSFEFL